MKRVIIVGAGLGGLSAGIQLLHAGFDVTIIDKNLHSGGKMMPVQEKGYHFDFGPNTITMPHVFEQVFRNVGASITDYLEWVKLPEHTRNIFHDGEEFLQSVYPDDVIRQLERLDPFAAARYWEYLKEVNRLYNKAEQGFFHRTFQSWADYLSPSLSSAFMQVRPFETMHHFHQRYFKDERLLPVFNRYATYIGSSPYKSPATFSMIGHLEMTEGVYTVKGGTTKIAEAFTKLFKERGGKLRLGEEVASLVVTNRRSKGVTLKTGETIKSDLVIMNGDFITSSRMLIDEKDRPSAPDKKLDGYEPSISAFVILAGLKTFQPDIHHHQVYFPQDYKKEFTQIFVEKQFPDDPTIYICHSAASDRTISKGSNLFILVNAPAVSFSTEEEMETYKEAIYDRLERHGIPIREQLEVEKVYTPDTIRDQFYAYKGALYGMSSHRKTDAFLRPQNKHKDIDGVYFAGGTTHPGGGSPMVTLSGLNVARLIVKEMSDERTKSDGS